MTALPSNMEIIVNCLSCEREINSGYLCGGCTSRANKQLAELPHLYEAVGAYLRPSSQASDRVGSGGHGPDAPLPVREDALDLVGPGGLVTVLETWRQALYEDAGLLWPEPWGDYRGRLRRAVYGLQAQLDFVRRDWPQAGDFSGEVRDLHAAALSIVAPQERPLRAGNCSAVVKGVTCGAVLLARSGEPVRCRWCGAGYPAESWLDLAAKTSAA
ncbi:hypothetical protein ACWC5I_00880 [Kitasatospora sp. NPDC001574]